MVKSTLEFITLMAVHLSAWDRRGRARRVCVSAGSWSTELALTLRAAGTWGHRLLCVWKEFRSLRWWRCLECWMNVLEKGVYQDPWSKVKAKNKNKTEVNIRGLWLYSMFMFRLVITWLIGETVNQGKSLHFRKKMSSSLQLSITIPS